MSRFVSVGRIGHTRIGVGSGWLSAQAVSLAAFSGLAYATVAGHLGTRLTLAGCLWVGVVLLAALDLTVLVHEAGHALAALGAGLRVEAIILLAYGGATLREASPSHRVNRWTAAAGPLANLASAALCGLVLACLPAESAFAPLALVAGAFQALSALINLAPVARCDGARLFR